MNNSTKILFALAAGWLTSTVAAQDRIHYTGTELSNPTYHDGQLSPVVGVHNIQLVRANREHPDPVSYTHLDNRRRCFFYYHLIITPYCH